MTMMNNISNRASLLWQTYGSVPITKPIEDSEKAYVTLDKVSNIISVTFIGISFCCTLFVILSLLYRRNKRRKGAKRNSVGASPPINTMSATSTSSTGSLLAYDQQQQQQQHSQQPYYDNNINNNNNNNNNNSSNNVPQQQQQQQFTDLTQFAIFCMICSDLLMEALYFPTNLIRLIDTFSTSSNAPAASSSLPQNSVNSGFFSSWRTSTAMHRSSIVTAEFTEMFVIASGIWSLFIATSIYQTVKSINEHHESIINTASQFSDGEDDDDEDDDDDMMIGASNTVGGQRRRASRGASDFDDESDDLDEDSDLYNDSGVSSGNGSDGLYYNGGGGGGSNNPHHHHHHQYSGGSDIHSYQYGSFAPDQQQQQNSIVYTSTATPTTSSHSNSIVYNQKSGLVVAPTTASTRHSSTTSGALGLFKKTTNLVKPSKNRPAASHKNDTRKRLSNSNRKKRGSSVFGLYMNTARTKLTYAAVAWGVPLIICVLCIILEEKYLLGKKTTGKELFLVNVIPDLIKSALYATLEICTAVVRIKIFRCTQKMLSDISALLNTSPNAIRKRQEERRLFRQLSFYSLPFALFGIWVIIYRSYEDILFTVRVARYGFSRFSDSLNGPGQILMAIHHMFSPLRGLMNAIVYVFRKQIRKMDNSLFC